MKQTRDIKTVFSFVSTSYSHNLLFSSLNTTRASYLYHPTRL